MLVVLAYGCATTSQPPEPRPQDVLHGVASWYGEEFAGRTTANGEIFDPLLLTAAHRTLAVRHGPRHHEPEDAADRARARQRSRAVHRQSRHRSLVRRGAADRSDRAGHRRGRHQIVKSRQRRARAAGAVRGRRSPRRRRRVADGLRGRSAESSSRCRRSSRAPAPSSRPSEPVVVDRITVETQRGDVITRKQVGADGRTLEDVPVATGEAPTREQPSTRSARPRRRAARRVDAASSSSCRWARSPSRRTRSRCRSG